MVGVRFRRNGSGGAATLVVDGTTCGSMEVPFAMRIISSVGASVGFDHGSPVSERYRGPFPFEGTLPPARRPAAPTGGSRRAGGGDRHARSEERSAMSRQ